MLQIVFTGGPSTGKTTVLNALKEYFKNKGYNFLIVKETATEIMERGIRPYGAKAIPNSLFQTLVLHEQLSKEESIRQSAKYLDSETIVIYDRGSVDGEAYCLADDWTNILSSYKLNRQSLLDNYDAVFYFLGKSEYFTKENNPERYEKDANAGLIVGEKVLRAYQTHENLHIIEPTPDINDKITHVEAEIEAILHQPIKKEQKYLLDSIDINDLGYAQKLNITQGYLPLKEGVETRIRKITRNGDVTYRLRCQRKNAHGTSLIYMDRAITSEEYEDYLKQCVRLLEKTRYIFVHQGHKYKLDIFSSQMMLLEVEGASEHPQFPPFFHGVLEVTNDPNYDNINLAKDVIKYDKRKINCN